MSEQKYIYWGPCVGRPCRDILRKAEYYDTMVDERKAWVPCEGIEYDDEFMRYPVSDAEYRSHHWCLALGHPIPEGYKVSGFATLDTSYPVGFYHINNLTGEAWKVTNRPLIGTGPILEKIKPEIEWVIPTDEDARHRPFVQVCDYIPTLDEGRGKGAVLYGVTTDGFFITQTGTQWRHCRMDAKLREGWA